MKRFLLLSVLSFLFIQKLFAQATHVPGPAERRMTDSICSCVVKLDLTKITTKEEATAAYTKCIMDHADLLTALAEERKVDIGDKKAMESVGVDIAMNLIKEDCKGFKELALLLGGNDAKEESTGSTSGYFKRIESKGFNYVIIANGQNKETSFLWLRQFPDSEKFMNGAANFVGKKVSIKYQELEVYLPQAKGYYKVKEITELTVE